MEGHVFLIILILDVLHSSIIFLKITAQTFYVLFIVFNDCALQVERLYPKCSLRILHSIKHCYFTTKSFLNLYYSFVLLFTLSLFISFYMERKKTLKLPGCYSIIFQRKNYLTHRIPTVPKMYYFNLHWQIWDRQETGME